MDMPRAVILERVLHFALPGAASYGLRVRGETALQGGGLQVWQEQGHQCHRDAAGE